MTAPRVCPNSGPFTLGFIVSTLAAMAAIAGCIGGSGSSGFDIAEGLAIQRVVDLDTCEVFDSLTICPADTGPGSIETPSAVPTTPASPTPSPAPSEPSLPTATDVAIPAPSETPPGPADTTPTSSPPSAIPSSTRLPSTTETPRPTDTPTPTAVPSMEIVTNRVSFDGEAPLCVTGDTPATCFVDFEFFALGFATDVAFRVASRPLGAEAPWLVLDPIAGEFVGPSPIFVAPIPVDLSLATESPVERLQIVVLGFESDPGPVPQHVDRLSQTGADLAFAVEPLPIFSE